MPKQPPSAAQAAPPGAFQLQALTAADWRALAFVLIFALGVRGLHLWQIARNDPFLSAPVLDEAFNDAWAKQVLQLPTPLSPPVAAGQAFYKPPLYPQLLALAHSLSGSNYVAIRGLQLALGAVTCALIALLGTLLFGGSTGAVAGIIAAIYGPLISDESRLLSTGLEVFLVTVLLLVVLGAGRRNTWPWWLGVGLVMGLAGLARPLLLAPGIVTAAWVAFRAGGLRRALPPLALTAAGVAVFVLPVTLRNWHVGGEFVPICATSGINLFTGNHRGADGMTAIPPGARWEELQQEAYEAGATKPGAASRYWTGRALAELRLMPPAEVLRLYLRKLGALFTEWEIFNNVSYQRLRQESFVLAPSWMCFGLAGPLAILGAFLAFRGSAEKRLLVVFAVSLGLALLPYFVCGRFRLPAMPSVLILAAAFLVWAMDDGAQWLRDARGRAIPAALLAVVALLVVHADLIGARNPRYQARDLFLAGNALFFADQVDEALGAYSRAHDCDPEDPDPLFYMGLAYDKKGELQKAAEHYARAVEKAPAFFDARSNLGAVLVRMGRRDEAEKTLREAVKLFPDSSRGWLNLGVCLMQTGRRAEALDAARNAAKLDPQNVQAWLLQVDLLAADPKALSEAERAAQKAQSIAPKFPGTAIALAKVHLAKGEPRKAIKALTQVQGTPAVGLYLGIAAEQAGDTKGARRVYEMLIQRFGATPEAALARKRLGELGRK